ncbi:MAG: hypothetical protein ABGW99_07665 [Zunongwangia sp.]|uniref:hypothetical protein n=1 Tax=Zunongwangia sp. TaxID=1965325 RepID=UPI0032429894
MDLIQILKDANPNIIIFLLTTLVAFISWLIKGLVEKPLTESKNTFVRYFDKRIEILTEIKTRLNFIAYFPKGEDNLNYKEQLQTILLSDGKAAYLSKEIYDDVLRISIDEETDENLLLKTIEKLDEELYLKISKIQEEIEFYRSFSNYSPFRRFIGITVLSLQYIIALTLIFIILMYAAISFIESGLWFRIGIILVSIIIIYLAEKWLKS